MRQILDKPTYWVNKNSGAIYMVYSVKDYNGNPKYETHSLNTKHELMYFYRGERVAKFEKQYEQIADFSVDEKFFTKVLANKQLKNEFKWGVISKKDFWNKITQYQN
jgi:nickel-dependent lactate racemase